MSKSPIPPKFGEPPPKVVFDGFRPGSRAADILLARYAGEIKHFHEKARQTREISEQPGSHMHQKLSSGGNLRYTQNNGQERIIVTLSPREIAELPKEPPVIRRMPWDPVLAIDVLFENEVFVAGDVSTYTEGEPSGGGGTIPPLEDWILVFTGDPPAFGPDDPVFAVPPDEAVFGDPETDSSYYIITHPTLVPLTAGPYNLTSIGANRMKSQSSGAPGTFTTVTAPFDVGYAVTYYDSFPDISGKWEWRWTVPFLIPGGDPDVDKFYERNTYEFMDVLNVVALRVDEQGNDEEYTTISTEPFTDKRLKHLTVDMASKFVERTLEIEDPKPRVVGKGFVARPRFPVVTDIPSSNYAPLEIEVWIASMNLTKKNEYPEAKEVNIEDDDPSFTYDVEKEVRWTIRAREFPFAPQATLVTTKTESRYRHYPTPLEDGEGGPGTGPEIPNVPPETEPDVDELEDFRREQTWAFASGSEWEDPGANEEPAKPANNNDPQEVADRGVLQAELSGTTEVNGPAPLEREKPPDVATWDQPIQDMTMVAIITWTPPQGFGQQGKVEIEAA